MAINSINSKKMPISRQSFEKDKSTDSELEQKHDKIAPFATCFRVSVEGSSLHPLFWKEW